MARKQGAESRWRELVSRQASSGMSVREFCVTEGISEPSFYSWRRRLREPSTDGGVEEREEETRRRAAAAGAFVPVKLLETQSSLEILHPLGYRIQVTGDVDSVALRRVVEALDERGER